MAKFNAEFTVSFSLKRNEIEKKPTISEFFEFILKVLNFFLTLFSLAMVLFGLYRLLNWIRTSGHVHPAEVKLVVAHRLLLAVDQSKETHKLSSAWFLFLFMAIGVVLFSVSCFGCIGIATRSSCCLSFYSVLMGVLVLAELGFGAFIFFDHHWKEMLPTDKTGSFRSICNILGSHWKIMKWVALGVVILEVIAICLALYLQSTTRAKYDRDNDFVYARYQIPVTSQRSTPRSTPDCSFQFPVSPQEGTPTPTFQKAATPQGSTPAGGTLGGTPAGGSTPVRGTPGGTPAGGTPSRVTNRSINDRAEASRRRI